MLFHSDSTSVNIINLSGWHSEETHGKGALTVRLGALENEKEPWTWWLMILKTENYLKIRPQHWAPCSLSEHCGCSSRAGRGRGGVRPGPNDFPHPLLPAKHQGNLPSLTSTLHLPESFLVTSTTATTWSNLSKPLHSTPLHHWTRKASFNSFEKQQNPQHLAS